MNVQAQNAQQKYRTSEDEAPTALGQQRTILIQEANDTHAQMQDALRFEAQQAINDQHEEKIQAEEVAVL